MKKVILVCAMVALLVTSAVGASASDTLNSEASVSFDNSGTLSIVDPTTATGFERKFATMNIPFGMQSIPLYKQSYEAEAPSGKTNYGVIVADGRGEETPQWTLTAKITTMFEHDTEPTANFSGAIILASGTPSSSQTNNATLESSITIQSATSSTPGSDVLVMSADALGNGGFYAEWTPENISLSLGDDFSNIRSGDYTAAMLWTVSPSL